MSEPQPPGMEAVHVVISQAIDDRGDPGDDAPDPGEDLNWLLSTTDAVVWAREFCRVAREVEGFSPDEGWMIGWFANAMAAQFQEDHRRESQIQVGQAVGPVVPALNLDETVFDPESAVFQALGAATVCWEEMSGTGLFDSTRAKAIGDELVSYLRKHPLAPDDVTARRLDEVLTLHVDGWPEGYNMDPVTLVERLIVRGIEDEKALTELQIKHGEIEPPRSSEPQ